LTLADAARQTVHASARILIYRLIWKEHYGAQEGAWAI
jgi:hypothetical protein